MSEDEMYRAMSEVTDVLEKLCNVQMDRIEKKWPERGHFRDDDPEKTMENLGRNVVQFATAVSAYKQSGFERFKDVAIDQAADIVNLVAMVLRGEEIM